MSLTVVADNPAPMNETGILPTEYKVLIAPDAVEEVTKGGIIIPEASREKEQYAAMTGTLVASSPLAFAYDNWPSDARKPMPGDRVIYAKYSGAEVKGRDGKMYRLVNDKDIGAVLA